MTDEPSSPVPDSTSTEDLGELIEVLVRLDQAINESTPVLDGLRAMGVLAPEGDCCLWVQYRDATHILTRLHRPNCTAVPDI